MSWSRRFDDPIALPGRLIDTLEQAGRYIQKLPRDEQEAPAWQAAAEALIMAAEDRGPLMHAHIGMLRALNRNMPKALNPAHKESHWSRRKLRRDD